MQLFGSLKLLMALLGSSCPLFGRSGPKMGPQNCSQKCSKSIPKFDHPFFFCIFSRPVLDEDDDDVHVHFWNPFWTRVFAQNSKKIYKRNQDEPKRAIMSFKESFQNLKKPRVFTRFWVQRPPKRASRNPRAAQEAPKELQRPEKNLPKKIPINASVVKNALSRRSHF